jgi:TRAP-type mannitol/chloroaromatic compound transport system permease small subunit
VQKFILLVEAINTRVGHAFAWCIVLLTAAMSYDVIMLKLFRIPSPWAYDASYMLYGTLFIMAGPYALARNSHVRGDFLYRSWPPRRQAGMDLALYFLFFFPGILAFIYAGYIFAEKSWIIGENSSNSPNGPPLYPFKTLIPVVGVLMLMQGIAEVLRCVICLRSGRWPQRLHDVEELEQVVLQETQKQQGKAS